MRSALAGLLLVLLAAGAAAALAIPPPPSQRVNDYAGVLPRADRERLERRLVEQERQSGNQIVVAIFRSLEGESLEDVANRLFQAWRLGQRGLDNGVLFLVFVDDRRTRIEVGYGLEATLTDAVAASILRDVVAPRLRQGGVAEGVGAGVDAIAAAIAGAYQAPPRRPSSGGATPGLPVEVVLGLVLAAAVVGQMLLAGAQARRSRRQGWTGDRRGWTVGPPPVLMPPPTWGGGWSGGASPGSSADVFQGGGGSSGGGGASGSW